jgi:hypothetical protein
MVFVPETRRSSNVPEHSTENTSHVAVPEGWISTKLLFATFA